MKHEKHFLAKVGQVCKLRHVKFMTKVSWLQKETKFRHKNQTL